MVEESELKISRDDFGYYVNDEKLTDRPFLGERYLTVDEALDAIKEHEKLLSETEHSL